MPPFRPDCKMGPLPALAKAPPAPGGKAGGPLPVTRPQAPRRPAVPPRGGIAPGRAGPATGPDSADARHRAFARGGGAAPRLAGPSRPGRGTHII